MPDESMDVAAAAVAESDNIDASADATESNGDANGANGATALVAGDVTSSGGTNGVAEASEVTQSAPEPYREVPGGRAYEVIYVVRAGDPDGLDQTNQRVRDLIERTGGAIDNVRVSETRRTAYPIKKQVEGIYVVVNARFVKETNVELQRFFKLEESILRHMILAEKS